MVNQLAIPATNVAPSGFSPQPIPNPYATGAPPEGPLSALLFLEIPAGQLSGLVSVNISQFGMSMIQSMLVDNEANAVGITVNAGSNALNFGIQPSGSQIVPIFQTGVNLTINVTLTTAALDPETGNPVPVGLAFQIFNTYVPPASWVANLTVNGAVDIVNVTGGVNVTVSNVASIGVGIIAEPTGGARGYFDGINSVIKTMKAAPGTFKGFSAQCSAAGWLQCFDVSNLGQITLGVTTPTFSFPCNANVPVSPELPPEGLAFAQGMFLAYTTTSNGSTDTGAYLVGTFMNA